MNPQSGNLVIRLIWKSFLLAFVLVAAINIVGIALDGTPIAIVGFLLTPGIWVVYYNFDVNNHDLLPLVAAELINVAIYSVVIVLVLVLAGMRRGESV